MIIHISGLEPKNKNGEYMSYRISKFIFYWGYITEVLKIEPEILLDPSDFEEDGPCQEVRQFDKEKTEQIAHEIFERIKSGQLRNDIMNNDNIIDFNKATDQILLIIDHFNEIAIFCQNSGGAYIVFD